MDEGSVQVIRQVRQRLEALRRAGLDRIRVPDALEVPAEHAPPAPVVESASEPPPAPAAPAPPPGLRAGASLFEENLLDMPVVPAPERPGLLQALAEEVAKCERCPVLVANRTRTVFGEGNPSARLMFIGEAPGAEEDRTGRPFVGRAGELLTDMITKGMGLKREDVYIANIIKSRPPENRNPLPDEVGHCLPYLERQVEIIRPQFICLLGRVAATALLDSTLSLGYLRRKWHSYKGIPTIVTYHPAFLLRSPGYKKDTWEDLQMLMAAMGLTPPARKGTSG